MSKVIHRPYFKMPVDKISSRPYRDLIPTLKCLYLDSILYSCEHLSDGIFPIKTICAGYKVRRADLEKMYSTGLWDRIDDSWAQVSSYQDFHQTRAAVEATSQKRKAAINKRWHKTNHTTGHTRELRPREHEETDTNSIQVVSDLYLYTATATADKLNQLSEKANVASSNTVENVLNVNHIHREIAEERGIDLDWAIRIFTTQPNIERLQHPEAAFTTALKTWIFNQWCTRNTPTHTPPRLKAV